MSVAPSAVEPGAAAAAAAAGAAESPAGGIIEEVGRALAAAREAVAGTLELAALEARRAGVAIIWMIVWSLVAVVCVVAAWLGLMAALGMWAVSLGFPPIATVACIALINLGMAGALVYASIRMGHHLLFSATRRQLAGKFPVTPPPP